MKGEIPIIIVLMVVIILSGCVSHSTMTTQTFSGKVAGIEWASYGNYIVFNDGTKLLNKDKIQIAIGKTYQFTVTTYTPKDFWGRDTWEITSYKIIGD